MTRLRTALAATLGLAATATAATAATPFEWSRGEIVSPTTTRPASFQTPAIGLAPGGSAALAWVRERSCCTGVGIVEVAERNGPAAGFRGARQLSPRGRVPAVALNDRGDLVVATLVATGIRLDWRRGRTATIRRTVRRVPSAGLQGAGRLFATIDAAGRGVVTAALPSAPGGASNRVVTLVLSGTPGTWTQLPELTGGDMREIAVDASGAAVVDVVTDRVHRLARRDPSTLSWQTSAPVAGAAPSTLPAYSVAETRSPVAVNARGDVGVALSDLRQSRPWPFVVSWPRSVAGPSAPVQFAGPGAAVESLSFNRIGGWLAAWTSAPPAYDAAVDLRLTHGSLYSQNAATRPLTRGRATVAAGLTRGKVVGVIRRLTGPAGRGPATGFATNTPGGVYDPRIYDRRIYDRLSSRTLPCTGLVAPLVLDPVGGRAMTACASPEGAAPLRVFTYRAPTGVRLTYPKVAFRGRIIAVRVSAKVAGTVHVRLRNASRSVSGVAIAPRRRAGVVRLRVPRVRGAYELRSCFTPIAKPQRCEVRTVTVR